MTTFCFFLYNRVKETQAQVGLYMKREVWIYLEGEVWIYLLLVCVTGVNKSCVNIEVWLFAVHPVYAWYCVSRVNWSVEQHAEFLSTQPLLATVAVNVKCYIYFFRWARKSWRHLRVWTYTERLHSDVYQLLFPLAAPGTQPTPPDTSGQAAYDWDS